MHSFKASKVLVGPGPSIRMAVGESTSEIKSGSVARECIKSLRNDKRLVNKAIKDMTG